MFAGVADCLLAVGLVSARPDQPRRRVGWRGRMGFRAELIAPGDGVLKSMKKERVRAGAGTARLAQMLRKTSSVG